jgi:hypothetical protein
VGGKEWAASPALCELLVYNIEALWARGDLQKDIADSVAL